MGCIYIFRNIYVLIIIKYETMNLRKSKGGISEELEGEGEGRNDEIVL